jgi:hypothetical protein
MGTFDEMKDKAQDAAGEHSEQVDQGMEKAGEFVDEKTGGKHTDKIDRGVDKAGEAVDKFTEK